MRYVQVSTVRLAEDPHELGNPPAEGPDQYNRLKKNEFVGIDIARMRYIKWCVRHGVIDEGLGPMVQVGREPVTAPLGAPESEVSSDTSTESHAVVAHA